MGTSASTTGPNNSSLLIPPWAESGGEQVTLVPSGGSSEEGSGNNTTLDNEKVQDTVSSPSNNESAGRGLQGARRAFGDYAKSGGGSGGLRKSLKSYSRSAKGKAASRTLASGITSGSGLFGLMSGDTVNVGDRSLHISQLKGLSADQAIDRISEHLCPNSADADQVRVAIDYALSEALEGQSEFDSEVFEVDLIGEVIASYLTDLVFQEVLNDMGNAWFHAESSMKEQSMEVELRELVKVVTETQLDKITKGDLNVLTRDTITQVQIATISQTIDEWENY